jgi:hypothetical protein
MNALFTKSGEFLYHLNKHSYHLLKEKPATMKFIVGNYSGYVKSGDNW